MTKHAGFSSDEAVATVVAPAPSGLHFTPFPPTTKAAARDCKKLAAAVHVDIAAPVGGGSWFESMKDSSPRRAADAEHGDWMVPPLSSSSSCFLRRGRSIRDSLLLPLPVFYLQEKHPSALTWFEAALGAAKGKQIVMFLDYDGTLSPIVEDPDRAVMSEEVGQQNSSFPRFSSRCKRFSFLLLRFSCYQNRGSFPVFFTLLLLI